MNTGRGAARRIALVAACPFPSPQGSQVFVGQMAERLAAAGHDVHLLSYGQGERVEGRGYEHHRSARLPGDDSRRSGPNLVKPLLDAVLAAKLFRLVRSRGIEILHAHNYEAAVAALAVRALTRVPVVYHSHNLMGDELETYFEGRASRAAAARAGRALDRSVPPRADRTIALCEWSAAKLRDAGCKEEALFVIPPAVDDEGPLERSAGDRRRLGLDEEDYVVGYSGNLDAYQNLGLLLTAMARVRAVEETEGPRTRLLVATHAITPAQRRFLAGFGLGSSLRIVELGSHAEARRALAASDVLALPRRLGSGYPVKLLNYMGAARAVLAAGCGSKVLRDGIDGILVGDDDPEAFAAAVLRLRDASLRRELGNAARRSYLAKLTWEQVLPRIEAVYGSLRERAGAPGSERVPE